MTKQSKNIFILAAIITTVVGLFVIANFFGSGEKAQSEKPLVICQPIRQAQGKPQKAPPEQQKCFWTAHIHADIKLLQDGKEIYLDFEQGELERTHTHAEEGKSHWHGLITADPQTKEVTDWSALSVEQLLKDLALSIEDGPRIIVNGKEVDLLHTWKDGDIIEIRYAK